MRRVEPLPGIAAKYDDTCVLCDQPINRNDRIAFRHGRPVHCACQMKDHE